MPVAATRSAGRRSTPARPRTAAQRPAPRQRRRRHRHRRPGRRPDHRRRRRRRPDRRPQRRRRLRRRRLHRRRRGQRLDRRRQRRPAAHRLPRSSPRFQRARRRRDLRHRSATPLVDRRRRQLDPNPAQRGADASRCSTTRHDSRPGTLGRRLIAGGADDDVIFGQLGDDWIQGDGSVDRRHRRDHDRRRRDRASRSRTGRAPARDGDDWIEGNGGDDTIFGGLGQDDLIGGSSDLFGLTTPDRAAGRRATRSSAAPASGSCATTSATSTRDGHAHDADVIMGDNANIYRLVGIDGTPAPSAFLTFTYDTYARRRARSSRGPTRSSTTPRAARRPTSAPPT